MPDDSRHYSYFNYIPDGSGGVIVTWVLEKASGVYADVRARKLDAGGNVRWDEQGVPVYDIPGIEYQKTDTVLGDRSGGIIVVGILGESPLRGDMVYAQRLDTGGNPLWGGGIRVDR